MTLCVAGSEPSFVARAQASGETSRRLWEFAFLAFSVASVYPLWRVQEGSLWAAPEVGACMAYEYQMYDLVARRYVVDNWTAEGEVLDLTAGKEGRVTAANFTPDEMRRRGER